MASLKLVSRVWERVPVCVKEKGEKELKTKIPTVAVCYPLMWFFFWIYQHRDQLCKGWQNFTLAWIKLKDTPASDSGKKRTITMKGGTIWYSVAKELHRKYNMLYMYMSAMFWVNVIYISEWQYKIKAFVSIPIALLSHARCMIW